ncbi:MAG: hypothetical protein D8M57_17365 [Candidatus Scalindua sp. AMX11]|nr:MAG: hypothetical protein DWQ00_17635 [Candidatus Scalindua sp.]NOG83280.1 protein kinase [Planctomycetota bacterium]RZV71958.1 MAG: hypothetical protein EX341_14620 [Candidatus Scalindua sp. SCAELEC01]TDE63604.1 MAG: hypothetical protein D8M57_17365 [Candidatus Scalindua sp. AMX11]GJQ60050.1 MAG: hypothetical protein SCALA701_28510 [Candidatus Scalindua sp.]
MFKIKEYKFRSFKLDANLHKSNYAKLEGGSNLGLKYNPSFGFEDEFIVLQKLNHKQIPKVYDYGQDTMFEDEKVVLTQHFIVLDHMSSIDLVKHFKEKTTSNFTNQLDDIIRCFISVCDPLDYLHTKNILHCDIKPGHLMVDPNKNTVYLIDYELAIKKAGLLKGISRGYSSPEQEDLLKDLRNPPEGVPPEAIAFFLHLDDRSDIYSLGAVMYEVLTNRIWKETKTAPRTHNKLIPHKLEEIVMATLEEDPPSRIATATQLKQSLQNLL